MIWRQNRAAQDLTTARTPNKQDKYNRNLPGADAKVWELTVALSSDL